MYFVWNFLRKDNPLIRSYNAVIVNRFEASTYMVGNDVALAAHINYKRLNTKYWAI